MKDCCSFKESQKEWKVTEVETRWVLDGESRTTCVNEGKKQETGGRSFFYPTPRNKLTHLSLGSGEILEGRKQ